MVFYDRYECIDMWGNVPVEIVSHLRYIYCHSGLTSQVSLYKAIISKIQTPHRLRRTYV